MNTSKEALIVGEKMKKKKKKAVEVPPSVPENWDRCHAYMLQKRRFCRQRPPQPSSIYCGNHQHLEPSPPANSNVSGERRRRIPCPIDPSHMIFEDMVDKHLPICPHAKKRKRQTQEAFYKDGVNAGGHGDLCLDQPQQTSAVETGTVEWAQQIALQVLNVHQRLFGGDDREGAFSARDSTWQDLHDSIPLQDWSKPELEAGIVPAFESHRIKSGGSRHIPQLASLVGHLREIQVLPPIGATASDDDKPLMLLEMGAGRGMFGLTAAGVAGAGGISSTHLIMVERAGSRSKADKILRSLPPKENETNASRPYLKLETVRWSRIDCDLAHVHLPVVLQQERNSSSVLPKDEQEEAPKVVVIAKHLCGAGTDLALKSLESIKDKVDACVLATCCHGICDWKAYVGRDYLRHEMIQISSGQIQFGPAEFDLMRRWCAGAVACHKTEVVAADEKESSTTKQDPQTNSEEQILEEEELEHGAGGLPNETEESQTRVNVAAIVGSLQLRCGVQGLGRACQRLIDHGRLEYLRKNIFKHRAAAKTELCHYVCPEVTPQNAVLIGYSTAPTTVRDIPDNKSI